MKWELLPSCCCCYYGLKTCFNDKDFSMAKYLVYKMLSSACYRFFNGHYFGFKKHFCILKLVLLKTILHHTEQRSICIYYKAICYSNSFLALLYKTRCCLPHLLNGFGNSNSSKLRDGNQFFCITNLLCNVFGWEKAAQHSLLQKWFRSLFIYFWKGYEQTKYNIILVWFSDRRTKKLIYVSSIQE